MKLISSIVCLTTLSIGLAGCQSAKETEIKKMPKSVAITQVNDASKTSDFYYSSQTDDKIKQIEGIIEHSVPTNENVEPLKPSFNIDVEYKDSSTKEYQLTYTNKGSNAYFSTQSTKDAKEIDYFKVPSEDIKSLKFLTGM